MSERFLLTQLSDPHVCADEPAAAEKLAAALAQAGAYRPDAILITGDLTRDGRPEEYAALVEVLAAAPAPVFVLPGNHDDREAMRAAFPELAALAGPALSYTIERFPLRIVALDQLAPGETHGVCDEACAAWLDAALAARPAAPTLVALHHQPVRTYDVLFDRIGLRDAERFAAVIARHKQVVRIVCGHHHRMAVGQVAHAPLIVAPSTAWVFSLALRPDQEIAKITQEAPGWVLHVWSREGGMASHFLAL